MAKHKPPVKRCEDHKIHPWHIWETDTTPSRKRSCPGRKTSAPSSSGSGSVLRGLNSPTERRD